MLAANCRAPARAAEPSCIRRVSKQVRFRLRGAIAPHGSSKRALPRARGPRASPSDPSTLDREATSERVMKDGRGRPPPIFFSFLPPLASPHGEYDPVVRLQRRSRVTSASFPLRAILVADGVLH